MRRTKIWAPVVLGLIVVSSIASCGAEGSSDGSGSGATAPRADLLRSDVACTADALGEDDATQFVDAYYVVDGALGAVCFGEPDSTMPQAWDQLAAITPPDQLNDLALFAGFSSGDGADEESDGTTLAFVNVIDDDGTAFQMSVNLDAYDEDPDEAALTMAHEFSHVFTATANQLDRSPEAADACDTYANGEGCYLPDSLMAEWIERFWAPEDLAKVDPDRDVGVDDGAELCAADPSYLGPYAATTPEEDFAESFAAFVYRVDPPSPEVGAKLDWLAAQPGLAEFRDRAVDAGMGPLTGSFEACGS